MKFLVALACLLSVSYAQYNNQQYNHNNGNNNNAAPVHYVNVGAQLQGDYKFGYNTGKDGSFREETRNPDGSVSGAYGYIDASGQQKIIRYTAGKDGFKAEGDDIPKAPAVPQQAAPQPAYNHHPQPQQHHQPQQYNHQQQQYNPPQQQYYQPQPSYNYPPAVPSYSSNHIQYNPPQQQSYGGYSQYGGSQQQGVYNPFAYITQDPRAAPQQAQPIPQLSYNIGSGGNNQYQG